MSIPLAVDDKVMLIGFSMVEGVVTKVHGLKDNGKGNPGITVKWNNGNVVDISALLAKNIVRKL